jgi:hypothetical protein
LGDVLRNTLGIPLKPLIVVLLLVAFSVGLCFVFAVDSTKSAFYRGASILAVLMTLVPYKVPPSIPTSPDEATSGSSRIDEVIVPAVFAQTREEPAQKYRIDVHLTTPGGKKVSSAIYTLIDPATKGVIARSNIHGNDFSFYVTGQNYVLRVEMPGYRITERQLSVHSPQSLTIALSPTSIPLSLQRVWRSP